MKVLVACEFSGRVREAFRAKGHDAWSCDILPADDDSPYHIQDDVLKHLGEGWDLMIAHPPCTYLSNAGATWLYPKPGQLNQERYEKGLGAKKFFMALLEADIPMIAVENPVQSLVYKIPKYTQIIQPYQFGEPYSKKTCLWLKGLPKLQPTKVMEDYVQYVSTGSATRKGLSAKDGMVTKTTDRNKTFKGIANAMAEQWGEPTPPKGQEDKR